MTLCSIQCRIGGHSAVTSTPFTSARLAGNDALCYIQGYVSPFYTISDDGFLPVSATDPPNIFHYGHGYMGEEGLQCDLKLHGILSQGEVLSPGTYT